MEPNRTKEDVVRAVEALPPLPAVALRVMQVSQDEKASASDLALVVSADPAMSARVLRIANSAMYRRAKDVTSVQEALVVLGFVQARNVAVSTAIASAYAPDALNALFRIETFWRHSLAVAFTASDLAAQTRRLDVPSAFTAGIVHDMGRLAMFYADPAGVDQAVAVSIATGKPLDQVERDVLGYDHAEVGGMLATRWRLPSEVRDAIAQHHGTFGPEVTLASVVAAADVSCIAAGVLPGYVAANTYAPWTGAFERTMRQVDSLMEIVSASPPGIRLAS
jgi:putative nucleotidyltransferase with HDIG domain